MLASRSAAAAAVLLAGVLAACSGAPAETPVRSPVAAATPAPTPTPTGLAALPDDQALDAVATAFARSAGVSVKGSVTADTNGNTERIGVDVHLVRGQGGRGTISPPDSTMQVIVIGKNVWLTGDKRFLAGAVGAKNVKRFQGKYVAGTTSDPLMAAMQRRFQLLDYASLLPSSGLRPRSSDRAGDAATITYVGDDGATLVVRDDEANPLPLRYTGPATAGPVDLAFGYERPVELVKPPKRKVLS